MLFKYSETLKFCKAYNIVVSEQTVFMLKLILDKYKQFPYAKHITIKYNFFEKKNTRKNVLALRKTSWKFDITKTQNKFTFPVYNFFFFLFILLLFDFASKFYIFFSMLLLLLVFWWTFIIICISFSSLCAQIANA